MNNIFNMLQTGRLRLQYTASNASENSRRCAATFMPTFVLPPLQRLLQSLQIFVGLSTGPCLQNLPNAVIHTVENWRVGRPFRRCVKVEKMVRAPLLRRFHSVGWSGILFKCILLSAKVATGQRNYDGVQDVAAAIVLVNY